ncbi:MAG: hypothetical protein C0496_15995 [Erythrobacter sp.]|nr:hypothetical protein [Erythrobacter sp.]
MLSLSSDPLTRGEIAVRTGLYRAGIPRVLGALEDQGMVESIGQGRSRPMRLRQQHPLAQTLRNLFWEEQGRAQRLVEALRLATQQLEPPPKAAWIEGPVAVATDTYTDPVIIGILAEVAEEEERWRDTLRRRVNDLQRQSDVAIEIRFWWKADMLALARTALEHLETVTPLVGPPPLDLLGLALDLPGQEESGRMMTHESHELTSRQYGKALARLLRRRPSLIEDTVRYLERRLPSTSRREALELQEWLDMLQAYSPVRLRLFLESTSERAIRLRQSAPFVHVLSEEDRRRLRQEALAVTTRESKT